jgi:hypothetical protein
MFFAPRAMDYCQDRREGAQAEIEELHDATRSRRRTDGCDFDYFEDDGGGCANNAKVGKAMIAQYEQQCEGGRASDYEEERQARQEIAPEDRVIEHLDGRRDKA